MSEQAPQPSQAPELDVDMAFDPEKRQAQPEWQTYLDNRPDMNEAGQVLHPTTGEVIENPDAYFDEQREISRKETQGSYEDMSIPALAYKLGEAEFYGDKTTETSVHEVLMGKMKAEDERLAEQGDSEIIEERRQNVVDSAMAAKDLKIRQLEKQRKQEDGGEDEGDEASDSPEEDNGKLSFKDTVLGNTPGFDPEEYVRANQERLIKAQRERREPNLPKESNGSPVMYAPDDWGGVGQANEFRWDNEVINWDRPEVAAFNGSERQIIIRGRHPSGEEGYGSYLAYIEGDKLYEIVQGSEGHQPAVRTVELTEQDKLPNLRIGQNIGGFELSEVLIGRGNIQFAYDWKKLNQELGKFAPVTAEGNAEEVRLLLHSMKDQGLLPTEEYDRMKASVGALEMQAMAKAGEQNKRRGDNPFREMEEIVRFLENSGTPDNPTPTEPESPDDSDTPTPVIPEDAIDDTEVMDDPGLEQDPRFDEDTRRAFEGEATFLSSDKGEVPVWLKEDSYMGSIGERHLLHMATEKDGPFKKLADLEHLQFSPERLEQMYQSGMNEEVWRLIQSLAEQDTTGTEDEQRPILFDDIAIKGVFRTFGSGAVKAIRNRISRRRNKK